MNSVEQLVDFYRKINPDKELYIGIEWERSAVYEDSLAPVTYEGDRSYLAILKKLAAEVGWEIMEGHRNKITELKRGDTRVTIEGDGRLELSGSPKENLHDLAREFRIHANEVQEMSDFFKISWLSLGIQPFHSNKEIKMIGKDRYEILHKIAINEYMDTQMLRTNGLTINFSFTDEENAIRKTQTAFRIIPIIAAIYACSPLVEGKVNELLDYRRLVVQNFAPNRSKHPKNILDKNFSLKDFIDFYLDLDVIIIVRDGKQYHPEKDLTFRQWIEEGYEGFRPTFFDFDQHVKTVWTDIRLRPSYLEYRVPDSVPLRLAMSIPALIKGLVFDSENWEAIEELTGDWGYDTIVNLDRESWKTALQTKAGNRNLLWYAKELINLSSDKLHKFGRTSAGDDKDESIFLAPLKEQIYIKEKSPAEEIVELWNGEWEKNPRKLVEWCQA